MMDRILEESKDSVTCAICTDVFDDPRTLSCSHSFCMHCLIEFRGVGDEERNKFCPICRELTVPPLGSIQSLPPNEFAAKVAKLIKETQTPNSRGDGPSVEEEPGTGDGIFLGDLIVEPESDRAQSSAAVHVGASLVLGAAVAIGTGGLLGALAGLAVLGFGAVSSAEAENRRKLSYQCPGCQLTRFTALRYRCGICDDFFLCPSCFENSAAAVQLHNAQHLFLKLKFKQRRQLPPGAVFKPKIEDIVKSIDYQSNKHGRAYVHSPQRLVIQPAIQCKSCGQMPITGFRYKCGMCKDYDLCGRCEQRSEEIHNKNHVFIVMRNHSEINITSEPLLLAHFY